MHFYSGERIPNSAVFQLYSTDSGPKNQIALTEPEEDLEVLDLPEEEKGLLKVAYSILFHHTGSKELAEIYFHEFREFLSDTMDENSWYFHAHRVDTFLRDSTNADSFRIEYDF